MEIEIESKISWKITNVTNVTQLYLCHSGHQGLHFSLPCEQMV